ncbi:MAG: TssQ family T6SS-associated lipoprotein [Rhodoferax sp.]|uniref:TssQ family T6SS-associated lipoprotein n=1 Tax=Rhodoferax sp. TaxID=50421 RepID=UPI001B5969AC|nr:TssQ family T6SS-associated lipoprotein [Rhodoferax sp.]MBP8286123.1 TssQ family T6SS-associated lipoprotein [Rhodoferax sp.]MBP9147838.1 TssQ family T6SS-associated lipoprotein [Rhodoferax sp.]MBP9737570.1 TssQ family T6SS-associated lipoprotein [Rhodoferax sp.]
MKFSNTWLVAGSLVFVVAGCATAPDAYKQPAPKPVQQPVAVPVVPEPPAPPPPPPPVEVAPEPSPSEKSLAEAVASFERGEYSTAMKQLSPLTTDQALDTAGQLKALKTLAFSQCLTRAVVSCRKTFERAFKLDPNFDLAAAEQGHPVWGPQFLNARKNLKIK